MSCEQQVEVETLRKAIENLINAKLHDALGRPGGLGRLIAHRASGVASRDVRDAEQQLEEVIGRLLLPDFGSGQDRRRPPSGRAA